MQLTRNFSDEEFKCECCGEGFVNWIFLLKLQRARDATNTPFHINSGWRCKKHNKEVGGVPNSSHMKGTAADIRAEGTRDRYHILKAVMVTGFNRIGIRKTFIHVDDDGDKQQGVIWL